MCRLDVRLICGLVGIHFEEPELGWVVLLGNGVDCQHSGLHTDRSFHLLLYRRCVAIELSGVDLQFGNADEWHIVLLGDDSAVRRFGSGCGTTGSRGDTVPGRFAGPQRKERDQ